MREKRQPTNNSDGGCVALLGGMGIWEFYQSSSCMAGTTQALYSLHFLLGFFIIIDFFGGGCSAQWVGDGWCWLERYEGGELFLCHTSWKSS